VSISNDKEVTMAMITDKAMPHLSDTMFLTDAGFETWLLFHKGFEMPHFAAFPLVRDANGRAAMREYFAPFLNTAREHKAGFVLDTNTWRANPDWAKLLGYDLEDLAVINQEAVALAAELRDDFGKGVNVLISGTVGPRGDGYDPSSIMSVEEAEDYHKFARGDWNCACRCQGRGAVCDQLHTRNRWPPANW
jgi:homocysteine S-methyltransferase